MGFAISYCSHSGFANQLFALLTSLYIGDKYNARVYLNNFITEQTRWTVYNPELKEYCRQCKLREISSNAVPLGQVIDIAFLKTRLKVSLDTPNLTKHTHIDVCWLHKKNVQKGRKGFERFLQLMSDLQTNSSVLLSFGSLYGVFPKLHIFSRELPSYLQFTNEITRHADIMHDGLQTRNVTGCAHFRLGFGEWDKGASTPFQNIDLQILLFQLKTWASNSTVLLLTDSPYIWRKFSLMYSLTIIEASTLFNISSTNDPRYLASAMLLCAQQKRVLLTRISSFSAMIGLLHGRENNKTDIKYI